VNLSRTRLARQCQQQIRHREHPAPGRSNSFRLGRPGRLLLRLLTFWASSVRGGWAQRAGKEFDYLVCWNPALRFAAPVSDWRTDWRTKRTDCFLTRPLHNAETPDLRGLPSAAEWSRTITSREGHKALKILV